MILRRLALLRCTIGLGPASHRHTDAPQIPQHSQEFLVDGRNGGERGFWKAGEVPLQRTDASRFPVCPPWSTRSHQHVTEMRVAVYGNRSYGARGQQPPQPVVFREKKVLVRWTKRGQSGLLLQQAATGVDRGRE